MLNREYLKLTLTWRLREKKFKQQGRGKEAAIFKQCAEEAEALYRRLEAPDRLRWILITVATAQVVGGLLAGLGGYTLLQWLGVLP